MRILPTTLLLVSMVVTWSSCADPKDDLIQLHYDLYTQYLADTDYLMTSDQVNEPSKRLLAATQKLTLADATTLGEEYHLPYLLKSYYYAVQSEGVTTVPLLDYVATMPKHPLSYQGTRLVTRDQTKVAPTPWVAVYYEGSGRKVLEWVKYDNPNSTYLLDAVYILRQLEKRLAKEVKDAKADYPQLDVDSYLKNRFDKTTRTAIDQEINQLRPQRLRELGTGLQT